MSIMKESVQLISPRLRTLRMLYCFITKSVRVLRFIKKNWMRFGMVLFKMPTVFHLPHNLSKVFGLGAMWRLSLSKKRHRLITLPMVWQLLMRTRINVFSMMPMVSGGMVSSRYGQPMTQRSMEKIPTHWIMHVIKSVLLNIVTVSLKYVTATGTHWGALRMYRALMVLISLHLIILD